MTETRDAAAERLARSLLEALGDRDWSRIEQLCAPDYTHHAPRVPAADVQGYIATAQNLFTAFPNMTATVLHLIPARDWVTVHYRAEGTHRAPFAGVPATGQRVAFDVLGLLHIRDEHLAEGWFEFDTGELVAQLTPGSGPDEDPHGAGRP